MRQQYETFVDNLMNNISNLALFREVEFGSKPASVDQSPGCYIIPQPLRCENITPNIVEWSFPFIIQVTKIGSFASKDEFMNTLDLVDAIIKMIESDPTIGGSVDQVVIDRIESTMYAERIDFMILITGIVQVQEV